jgi:hypothetical protein
MHVPVRKLMNGCVKFEIQRKEARFLMSRPIQPDPERPKVSRIEVYWTAVTYKTVALYGILILAIILAAAYLVSPETYLAIYNKVASTIESSPTTPAVVSQKQAHFVNLDGKVQVKKANSVQWVAATYRITLDKGDQIQTGPDGAARLTFADATTYTLKSDSFVTVEQNTVGPDKPSSTAMNVKTGAVDLTTAALPPDSKAALSIEDTVATVRQNSRVSAKTDPATNSSEIAVAQGTADIKRGEEHIELGAWEKAIFSKGSPIQKGNVLAPPDLTEPMNLQPLIVLNPKTTPIRFEWKPVPDAILYDLRVSNTSSFSNVLAGKKGNSTSVVITGLDAGDYFWNVTAIDSKKHVSEASETFKFTLVAQGKTQEMVLEIEGTQLHGKVAEIIGRTEPGAALIINGQSVASIQPDGRFRHFTEALNPGSHEIVITGQNRRGGTAITRVPIVVPK